MDLFDAIEVQQELHSVPGDVDAAFVVVPDLDGDLQDGDVLLVGQVDEFDVDGESVYKGV